MFLDKLSEYIHVKGHNINRVRMEMREMQENQHCRETIKYLFCRIESNNRAEEI